MEKENNTYAYDVSVIVIMYNPDREKLFQTLDSILMQRDLRYEIILCDDGSLIRYEQEICSYFTTNHFSAYSLIFHDVNHGTVSNYCSGLEKARGKYSKVISPGDYFAEETILCEWIRFMEDRRAAWSFSDTFYYRREDGKQSFIRKRAHPQIIRPYLKSQQEKCEWNYAALWDISNGAAILGETRLQLKYCKTIREKGVCYAEDLMFWLLMFDGIVGCYYPKTTICYEYGTGISTSNKPFWEEKLQDDRNALYRLMQDREGLTDFQKAILRAMQHTKKTEKLFIRGKLYHWLKWHFFPRLTKIPKKQG